MRPPKVVGIIVPQTRIQSFVLNTYGGGDAGGGAYGGESYSQHPVHDPSH